MKVFLSWSGNLSKRIATELREWLPLVIQALEPWLSHEDIEKGSRWSPVIAKELAESKAGIICVTPNNLESPWLNFEAGAISNTVWASKVCTYLFGVKSTDVAGPLSQFQSTITDREDTRRLITTLNKALEKEALQEKTLDKAFDAFWPQLEQALTTIASTNAPTPPARSDREIAEETLSTVRELLRLASASPLSSQYAYITYPGMISSNIASYDQFPAASNVWVQGLPVEGFLTPTKLITLSDEGKVKSEPKPTDAALSRSQDERNPVSTEIEQKTPSGGKLYEARKKKP